MGDRKVLKSKLKSKAMGQVQYSSASLVLLALLFMSPISQAQPQTNQLLPAQETVIPNNLVDSQPQISRRKASDLAQDEYEGRVLNIRLENNRWRVRMDDEGTVFNVYVNAQSGEIDDPEQ